LDDLGNPSPARVGRVLGLGERTIYRYNRAGYAPRAVQLALFWLTRWGRSAVHAQATNDAIVACTYCEALRREVRQLEATVSRLVALGNSGAANQPILRSLHGI